MKDEVKKAYLKYYEVDTELKEGDEDFEERYKVNVKKVFNESYNDKEKTLPCIDDSIYSMCYLACIK